MRKKSKIKIQNSKLKITILCFFALFFTLYILFFSLFRFLGWNGKDPMNIVVTSGEKVLVLAIRPLEKRLVEISIPDNTIVPVGSGKWQARSLSKLSKLEKNLNPLKSVGWELLEAPIDSMTEILDYQSENTAYFSQLRLLTRFDFASFSEAIKLIGFIKNLNDNQVLKINIGDTMAARIVADPAGTELVEVDSEILSLKLIDWFRIESLRREGLTIAVVNASGKTNAGGKLARQLEHVGLRVISVSSGEGEAGLKIKQNLTLKSETVQKISAWLKMKPEVEDFDARADILIVVK